VQEQFDPGGRSSERDAGKEWIAVQLVVHRRTDG
jgi:hypothetical protein